MNLKKIIVKAFLWVTFFSFSSLAFVISIDYTLFKPYITLKEIEILLLLSALMSSGFAGALIYIHGIKSWTTFLIGIGLIMAWWDHLVYLVLITTMSSSNFGG